MRSPLARTTTLVCTLALAFCACHPAFAMAASDTGSSFDVALGFGCLTLAAVSGALAWAFSDRVLQMIMIVLAAMLIITAGPAFAVDDTAVPLAPWVAVLKPYLDFLVKDVIELVIVPLLGYAIWRVTGIVIDTRYSNQITKLLTNQAAGLVATGAARLADQRVDVHSPALAEAARVAVSKAPNAFKWFGLDPASVEATIVQKIPQLPIMAAAVSVPAASPEPVPAAAAG